MWVVFGRQILEMVVEKPLQAIEAREGRSCVRQTSSSGRIQRTDQVLRVSKARYGQVFGNWTMK